MRGKDNKTKIKKLALVGLLIAIAAVVVISVKVFWLKDSPKEDLNSQRNEESISTPEVEDIKEKIVQTIPMEEVEEEEDEDEDGLTNAEEKSLGTDLASEDSDDDLISDYEELRVYNTDPLSVDSDGDGIEDGYEIALNLDPTIKDNTKNEYTLKVMSDDIKAEIEITGSPRAVATGRINKVENTFTDNEEYVGSIFIVNGDEDFQIESFYINYDVSNFNAKGINEEDLGLFQVDVNNGEIREVAATIDLENKKLQGEIMPRQMYMLGSRKIKYNYKDSRIIENLQVEFEDDDTKEISIKEIKAELVAKNQFDKEKDLKVENMAYRDAQGGICHGLASISAIEATGQKLPLRAKERTLFAGFFIKAEYDLTNKEISNNVRFADAAYWWWTTQERFGSTYSNKVGSVEQVINAIEEDPAVLLCMSGFKGLSMVGHTVLVSALYKDVDSQDYYIEIHDSNLPNGREFILLKEKYSMGKVKGVKLDPCKYEAAYKTFKLFDVYKRLEDLTAEGYFDFGDDTENLYNSTWSIAQDAYMDVDNNLVLTKADPWTSGVAWYKEEINGPFEASFRYKAGGGTGADGFVFMFNKDKYVLGEKGGYTAYNGCGYGIEFDSSGRQWNEWDPEGAHIGLVKETTEEHLQLKEDERVADNLWHDAVVQVTRNSIKVKIDNETVIDYEGVIDLSSNNIGFSAATGVATNWHIIDLDTFKIKNIK